MNIKNIGLTCLTFVLIFCKSYSQALQVSQPSVSANTVFEEKHGMLSIEAEDFFKQDKIEKRAWVKASEFTFKNKSSLSKLKINNASNTDYIQLLPDTRVTHDDLLIKGENFSNTPGKIAIVHYKAKFTNIGRYYIWVRTYSTGTEDNGIHVGLNGLWPKSGQRMQWCEGKNKWTWESKQRTLEEHCGIPYAIYLDIEKPGVHTIQFSMREDGFTFDKFIFTKDKNYNPTNNTAVSKQTYLNKKAISPSKPTTSYYNSIKKLHPDNKYIAAQDFPTKGSNFYKNGKNWLAINPEKFKNAETTTLFKFKSGCYDMIFVGVGENDGNSNFRIFINNRLIGEYEPPITDSLFQEGKNFNALWKRVKIKTEDKITVKAKVATDGNEWTRGRWAGIIFAPKGEGENLQDAPPSYTDR